MRNSYKIWSDDDIALLKSMTQNGVSMKRMEQVLGRSKRAIQHAFQNMLFQQCMYHPSPKVAEAYDMDMNDLVEGFVPPKYYQPLENEDIDHYEPKSRTSGESSTWKQTFFLGLLTATSLYYYVTVLKLKLPSPFYLP